MTSFDYTRALVFCAGLPLVASLLGGPVRLNAEHPDHVRQFRETGQCRGCDLVQANLVRVVAEAADLRGANLTGALLTHAHLRGANLDGASLQGANLHGTDLRGAVGANFSGAVTDRETLCPSGANGPC
ncbi:MAG: pentapeptide repeat-containing protein [Vicinamibacterales bacterium]